MTQAIVGSFQAGFLAAGCMQGVPTDMAERYCASVHQGADCGTQMALARSAVFVPWPAERPTATRADSVRFPAVECRVLQTCPSLLLLLLNALASFQRAACPAPCQLFSDRPHLLRSADLYNSRELGFSLDLNVPTTLTWTRPSSPVA